MKTEYIEHPAPAITLILCVTIASIMCIDGTNGLDMIDALIIAIGK